MYSPLTPSNLDLTQFQLDNLHKLLAYAKAHPDIPFDINWYLKEPDKAGQWFVTPVLPAKAHPCGTTCCLAGMGIFAGIKPLESDIWETYINRNFVDQVKSSDIADYLFHSDHANSLPHAIARLSDFLTNGLPQDVELSTHEIL